MRRANVISQAPEARAVSLRRSDYQGATTHCTGLTVVYGHALIDATAQAQIVTLDNSMDWRDRILIMNAFTPFTPAGGTPNSMPYLCTVLNPANNQYGLSGDMFLSSGGWDETSPADPAQGYCRMRRSIDSLYTTDVIFYAHRITGELRVKVAAGQNRGVTFMIQASEQLGYAVAVP